VQAFSWGAYGLTYLPDLAEGGSVYMMALVAAWWNIGLGVGLTLFGLMSEAR
jgi:hypothetical protein